MVNVRVLLIDAGEPPSMQRTVRTGGLDWFSFTRTATLSEGLHALQGSRFHLILLNLSLPDASATEIVKKTLEIARGLPVVALVNKDDAPKAAAALNLGVDDYVVKGCRCDALIQAMRHAIEKKQLMADREQALQLVTTTKSDAQLTAHLSHEFRNALACIHQFGTIMIDGLAGTVSDEQREYLCIIIENASKIRNVLDDALERPTAPRV